MYGPEKRIVHGPCHQHAHAFLLLSIPSTLSDAYTMKRVLWCVKPRLHATPRGVHIHDRSPCLSNYSLSHTSFIAPGQKVLVHIQEMGKQEALITTGAQLLIWSPNHPVSWSRLSWWFPCYYSEPAPPACQHLWSYRLGLEWKCCSSLVTLPPTGSTLSKAG